MATYAIGDIHGCMRTLEALLERVRYRPGADRIWLCGDLVNRGPDSLSVLRWAREQGEALVCVLGNHELHLLGAALRVTGYRMRSAFEAILEAPDRDELLGWVARRPLVHREGEWVLVHAGLLPRWSLDHAYGMAAHCEEILQGDGAVGLLSAARSSRRGDTGSEGNERDLLAGFLRVVTLVRLVDGEGEMVPAWIGPPRNRPPATYPWYEAPGRRNAEATVLFGHWAALGWMRSPGAICLDSGCVWGGRLSALRLEDGELFQQELLDPRPGPGPTGGSRA